MADDKQGFDPRPYLHLDNSMPENPKIVGLAAAADVVRHYGAEDVLWLLGLEEY